MAKIKIGDIFSIETPKGKAYLHYVYLDDANIELIRVLPGLYPNGIDNVSLLAKEKELFLTHFPLKAAYNRKIVKLEGYADIGSFKRPKYMRTTHTIRGKFLGWFIIDMNTGYRKLVKKLSSSQNAMSPYGIWNDTLLIESLTEGWTLDKWTESMKDWEDKNSL